MIEVTILYLVKKLSHYLLILPMVPDKYIQQLVEDMTSAKREFTNPFDDFDGDISDDSVDFDLENHFNEVENYLEFESESSPTFGQTIGLSMSQFPPAEKLSPEQMEVLYTQFVGLLYSYNVTTDIPDGLSVEKKYSLIISILNESLFLSEIGHTGWEFCTYESTKCPFGEDCMCIEEELRFEQDLKDALDLLESVKESCEGLLKDHGKAQIRISSCEDLEFDLMCMYIASGSDYVPYTIFQYCLDLEAACEAINNLFEGEDELLSLFKKPTDYSVMHNMEAFLSLIVEKFEDGIFYVEPYYIEDGKLLKGVSPYADVDDLLNTLDDDNE